MLDVERTFDIMIPLLEIGSSRERREREKEGERVTKRREETKQKTEEGFDFF